MNSPKEALKQKELMNMELAFNLLPYELIPFDFDTYFNSEMKNESVVTNLETGEAQYLDEREDGDRLLDIVRASCSIPFASKIAYVDDIPYLDGGVADSIPIKRALELPNEKIVVIRTRGKDYRKSPVSRGMVALYKKVYKNYPKAVKTMAFRNKVYNEQVEFLDEIEKEGKAFVINPMIKEPSRMEKDADKLINFYEHGYDTMRYKLDEMMKYIEG
jgi:predicted patatin/cPLA2 family phospholipase